MCEKICKSKSGLTRHTNKRHNDGTITSSKAKQSGDTKISEEDLRELVVKSFRIVSDSDLHLEELRAEAMQYSNNPPDIQELHSVINTIPRKNKEKFSTKFFATFLLDPCKFLPIPNRCLASLTLTKVCLLVLSMEKRKLQVGKEIPTPEITIREKAGLQYLGGYLLSNIFRQIKKKNERSPSDELEETIALLMSMKTTNKPENQRLVFALDRGGLWYTTEMFQEMIIEAEKIFFYEVTNREDLRKIDYVSIICKMMENSSIRQLFHVHTTLCDITISNPVETNTLHSILHLYLKVRAFNYTKDYVQKQRIKNDNSTKKALRKELKNLSTPQVE